ncbi:MULTISPECIES: phosphotransferase family protein [Halorussus]|uniref:phosphotransferase family protein n=1 Tax=Halorussus TaxID=1070314 RepID=UPI0013B381DD|nr:MULTISPECIES: phosphotransferase [Halorussus]NHN58828.1 phosphotransferase [Halorussus sp. JP-T4]
MTEFAERETPDEGGADPMDLALDVPHMVAEIAPDWSVQRIRPTEEGSDSVFLLTVATPRGRREVVLKAFAGEAVSPSVARSEPRVLELLAAETEIPVPEVIGSVDDHPDLPAPFFVAERLPGENGSGRFQDFSTDALARVLGEAGEHLAQLHEVRTFDRFGRIGVEDGDLAVVGDQFAPKDDWTDWLLADVEDTLDGIAGGRFDDLVGPLWEYVREAVPALDAPDEGVFVHWDYRLGNLLLDPETGEETGVLDWAGLVAGDPVYNLATVEDHNINWQTRDVVLRRRLRERFRAAYDASRSGDRLADFRKRKRVYHLCNRLNAMACLPDWYSDGALRDERAAEHRMFVRDYID